MWFSFLSPPRRSEGGPGAPGPGADTADLRRGLSASGGLSRTWSQQDAGHLGLPGQGRSRALGAPRGAMASVHSCTKVALLSLRFLPLGRRLSPAAPVQGIPAADLAHRLLGERAARRLV